MGKRTMSRNLRRAWICLGLAPVGFVLALVIGEVLPGLMGYGWTHEEGMPPGPSAFVMLPAVLLFSVPGLLAGWFGLRARREGEPIGLVPAIIGLAIAGYYLVINIAGLVFGRLGG